MPKRRPVQKQQEDQRTLAERFINAVTEPNLRELSTVLAQAKEQGELAKLKAVKIRRRDLTSVLRECIRPSSSVVYRNVMEVAVELASPEDIHVVGSLAIRRWLWDHRLGTTIGHHFRKLGFGWREVMDAYLGEYIYGPGEDQVDHMMNQIVARLNTQGALVAEEAAARELAQQHWQGFDQDLHPTVLLVVLGGPRGVLGQLPEWDWTADAFLASCELVTSDLSNHPQRSALSALLRMMARRGLRFTAAGGTVLLRALGDPERVAAVTGDRKPAAARREAGAFGRLIMCASPPHVDAGAAVVVARVIDGGLGDGEALGGEQGEEGGAHRAASAGGASSGLCGLRLRASRHAIFGAKRPPSSGARVTVSRFTRRTRIQW